MPDGASESEAEELDLKMLITGIVVMPAKSAPETMEQRLQQTI